MIIVKAKYIGYNQKTPYLQYGQIHYLKIDFYEEEIYRYRWLVEFHFEITQFNFSYETSKQFFHNWEIL